MPANPTPPAAPAPLILPLASGEATLALAGGKGANLAFLARSGFPVPDGFIVTTRAYQAFIAACGLEPRILAALSPGPAADPGLLAEAADEIRAMFAACEMPPALTGELLAAYARLGQPAVAVRSSATAEDLPGLSFAGQQETELNVRGERALLQAVVRCWSSLWTARAIAYRARNAVPQAGLALAVVVQRMVESEASGVLFTANPLSGLRSETVIDATLGLGEALVSGQVEPDHYVVDTASGTITAKTLGAKAIAVRGRPGGGTQVLPTASGPCQALPDAQILALAELGRQVGERYGAPQDIEWAWSDERLYLLQSRPITSLFPLPRGMAPEPLQVMFSFGAVQGLLDPLTPLGRDMIAQIFVAGAHLFGGRPTWESQTVILTAGERLWANITPLLRNTTGRAAVRAAAGIIEPTVGQAVAAIWDDPRLQPTRKGLSARAALRLARFLVPLAGNLLLNLLAPHRRRALIDRRCERALANTRARCRAIEGDPRARLAKLVAEMGDMAAGRVSRMLTLLISGVAAGMASFNILNVLARGLKPTSAPEPQPGWPDVVLEVARGLPHNPTTEMDLALWQAAQAIRRDPASAEAFGREAPAALAARFRAGTLPAVAQQTLTRFLDVYGARGLAELDIGRARWREDPTHVFSVVAGYLQIVDEEQAPDVVFARGAEVARAAIDRLATAARKAPRGRVKAALVRLAAGRARALLGAREVPKFFMVRLLGLFREELLALGRELAAAGELSQPDDLVYLSLSELVSFAAGEQSGWPTLIAERRERYRREMLRRQVPRLLLSDGRAFYEGLVGSGAKGSTLAGSPVSPGSVEGAVRVVLDPRQAGLLPGEILVCPGTDPSWTPLFLTAAGLVMEVGGMMTHGAVVAREYGIPAVVGVDRATERLRTGQRVRVDGSSGQVTILTTLGSPRSNRSRRPGTPLS